MPRLIVEHLYRHEPGCPLRRSLPNLCVEQHTPGGENSDAYLTVVAATLRAAAADVELGKVEQHGRLAVGIFEKIASNDGEAKNIFSVQAAADYSKTVGRDGISLWRTLPIRRCPPSVAGSIGMTSSG